MASRYLDQTREREGGYARERERRKEEKALP
jgi:hypothetical protein